MTHLLDTSALLAFIKKETGATQVRELFESRHASVAVSILTKAELWASMRSMGVDHYFDSIWARHLAFFDAVLGVDEVVADAAIQIRRRSLVRLPSVDSLIAGTARVHNLVLVHRDRHFRGIPGELLTQWDLAAAPG